MKERKKIANILIKSVLTVGLLLSMTVNAFAADFNDLGKIVDGSKLTNESMAEAVVSNPMRGNILNEGSASIVNKGNRTVNVHGGVYGSVVCDKLILEMTLQRYTGSYWKDVEYYSDTAYNKALLSKSYNKAVTGGYYYRVKAACVAQKGDTTETKDPITNGIWIE